MYSAQDTLAGGLPHSEIHGSKFVRNSPWLIAAYDVLHRLSAPRHPPNALQTLDRSHYRYPPARQQTRSFEKTSFLRGRARSQAAKTANLLDMPPHAGGIRTDLLFTMSDNTQAYRRSGNLANSCFLRTRGSTPGTTVLVEPDGIEPTTSCLQSRRSPN